MMVAILRRSVVPRTEEIISEVLDEFPGSKINYHHVAWYKNAFRKGRLTGQRGVGENFNQPVVSREGPGRRAAPRGCHEDQPDDEEPPIEAEELLQESLDRRAINLSVLIADTGLWANPEVHRRLLAQGGSAAWFGKWRRYRAGQGEQRRQVIDGIYLDDNSYANRAIKLALGTSRDRLIGFECCHIWPRTCYDPRYHTAIANLVLLPRALAGLTDHNPNVQAVLQYRAFELYGWAPAGAAQPERPPVYPVDWRSPMPFTPAIARALARRETRNQDEESEVSL
jgi:hypothetical protein